MTASERAERIARIERTFHRVAMEYDPTVVANMRWLVCELAAADDGLAICGGYLKTADAENARLRAALAAAEQRGGVPEGLIKHMVDRFLGWHLPATFNPDDGISYTPTQHSFATGIMPTGTNLFDAEQATAMVRYMIEGLSAAPTEPVQGGQVPGGGGCYRKKPLVIEAFHFGSGFQEASEWPEWLQERERVWGAALIGEVSRCGDELVIRTLEGTMTAQPGDWIIKGIKGEIYPCKPDIFATTYEPAASPQPPQSGGWQPIDTAPDDEELLLGWWQTTGPEGKQWKQEVGVAHDTRGRWFHGCATYWHPLPSPPQLADAGKE